MRAMILTTVFIIKAVNVTYNLVINVRIVFYFCKKSTQYNLVINVRIVFYFCKKSTQYVKLWGKDPPLSTSTWYDDIRPHFQPGKFDQ